MWLIKNHVKAWKFQYEMKEKDENHNIFKNSNDNFLSWEKCNTF
jgi:hypothetical protein